MAIHSFVISSHLNCRVDTILKTLTMAGVNRELWPAIRMSAPFNWRERPITSWPERAWLFESWILLFGVIPIDRHRFYFESIDPRAGFQEASTSWMNRRWRHHRQIKAADDGVFIIDTVEYEFRLPLVGWLMLPVYGGVFALRHRYLRRAYGVPGTTR